MPLPLLTSASWCRGYAYAPPPSYLCILGQRVCICPSPFLPLHPGAEGMHMSLPLLTSTSWGRGYAPHTSYLCRGCAPPPSYLCRGYAPHTSYLCRGYAPLPSYLCIHCHLHCFTIHLYTSSTSTHHPHTYG